jgi:hypothetical protein
MEHLRGGRSAADRAGVAPCGGGLKFLELFGYFLYHSLPRIYRGQKVTQEINANQLITRIVEKNNKIFPTISVFEILYQMRFVTEIQNKPHSLPWAAVHEDYSEYKYQCSTLPMAIVVSPTSGLLVEGYPIIEFSWSTIQKYHTLRVSSYGTLVGRRSADRAGGGL